MKRILITFIGNNDCRLKDGKEGAIISILKQRAFDQVYILYNKTSYMQGILDIKAHCKTMFPDLTVGHQEAESLNPIDYNIVYPVMAAAIKKILNKEGTKGVEYTISLTSGTPTMHSCWILLVMGGLINARLIQFSPQDNEIQEVNFSLDDFPQINSDKHIKIELTKTNRENILLRKQLLNSYSDLIGEHKSIIQIKREIDILANYDTPVFISGETGTGKEVVARLIHYNSNRKTYPFVPVNCGSIPENLFESLFFGHKKGSFTGAFSDQEGYFSKAHNGTLFLDEIGDLPMPMQVKLLRVLDRNVIEPVGGKPKTVNVRIVLASNKDLKFLVKEGKFREDLFFRIWRPELCLSPLRDRGTDILLLARHFLKGFSVQNRVNKGFSVDGFSIQAETKLLKYRYPGNVRELQTIIKEAYIRTNKVMIEDSDIILDDTTGHILNIEIPIDGIDLNNEIIPSYYRAALKRARGNYSEAARLLNLKPHTFRARIKTLEQGKNNDYNR